MIIIIILYSNKYNVVKPNKPSPILPFLWVVDVIPK